MKANAAVSASLKQVAGNGVDLAEFSTEELTRG